MLFTNALNSGYSNTLDFSGLHLIDTFFLLLSPAEQLYFLGNHATF